MKLTHQHSHRVSLLCLSILFGAVASTAARPAGGAPKPAQAIDPPPSIVSISVCSFVDTSSSSTDCPPGAIDTTLPVLAPDGGKINDYGGLTTLADEHSTVFPPGVLPGAWGYTFFVATRTNLNNISSGATALFSSGPDANNQWTLDFAPTFGLYNFFGPPGSRNGQLFLSPFQHDLCPTVAHVTQQDPTFELNYADPGSVVLDPTNPFDRGTGNLIMIYEADNRCIGLVGGDNVTQGNSFYSMVSVATSFDFGHSWPAYRYDLFPFASPGVPLPNQNGSVGPDAPFGATGSDVCAGNNCFLTQFFPNPNYGRYPSLGPQLTIQDILNLPSTKTTILESQVGDAVPSAFVDDVWRGYEPDEPRPVYLYEIHNYTPGPPRLKSPPLPDGKGSDMMIARAQLNGGSEPLSFEKWYEGSFSQPGLGGLETPVFPAGPFANCEDDSQLKTMGSISYVEATQQYLLTFVCQSPMGDPASGKGNHGAAWFFSTNRDLSHPENWTTPQQIIGSWSEYDPADTTCNDFNGWYPTFMSLDEKSGHLNTTGFVFYMKGCTGFNEVSAGGRQYSTRTFTITIH
jgi:hypothetical protein